MNLGVGLGILAFIQVLIAWLSDRSVETLDKPLFTDAVKANSALGIKGFFSGSALAEENPSTSTVNKESLGVARVNEVLRFSRLSSAALQTITALVVSLASLVGGIVLVATVHPKANLETLRIISAALIAFLVLIALIFLFIRIGGRRLSADLTAPGEMGEAGASRRPFWARYLARLQDGSFLSRYRTAAFIGAVAAIVIVVGI